MSVDGLADKEAEEIESGLVHMQPVLCHDKHSPPTSALIVLVVPSLDPQGKGLRLPYGT